VPLYKSNDEEGVTFHTSLYLNYNPMLVLRAVIFWVVTACSFKGNYRSLRETCHDDVQGHGVTNQKTSASTYVMTSYLSNYILHT
jgi:hypothetical protein